MSHPTDNPKAAALTLRLATPDDLEAIVGIYNHYVLNTAITFDTDAFTVASRRPWFEQFSHDGPYWLYVAVTESRIVGYAASMRFKEKAAYRTSVETSVYVDPANARQGIGQQLYSRLLETLTRDPGLHRAYGGITENNPASEALHRKLGFHPVASYSQVGYKFDRYWDVHWYEKDLSELPKD